VKHAFYPVPPWGVLGVNQCPRAVSMLTRAQPDWLHKLTLDISTV